MSTQLIVNATLVNVRDSTRVLRGAALAELPCIKDGWLLIEDEHIAALGPMEQLPDSLVTLYTTHRSSAGALDPDSPVLDASGRFILPAWCDSHTHLVYAGSRETEFVDKIKGLSYAEINAKGGGILNSARRLADTSGDQLFASAWQRLQELSR